MNANFLFSFIFYFYVDCWITIPIFCCCVQIKISFKSSCPVVCPLYFFQCFKEFFLFFDVSDTVIKESLVFALFWNFPNCVVLPHQIYLLHCSDLINLFVTVIRSILESVFERIFNFFYVAIFYCALVQVSTVLTWIIVFVFTLNITAIPI